MNYFITGTAGFIGFHTAKRLLDDGHFVCSIDNVNDYYDTKIKLDRLEILCKYDNFEFGKVDLTDKDFLSQIFETHSFDIVIHLAAQAGVRYSLENPMAYIDSNIVGFMNILELCRQYKISHLVYASSSSVYGGNEKLPFSVDDRVDTPISLYAATKKSNELMAHCYSKLYNIPTTGLRFFTVYGPYGRPDMALFKFTKSILKDEPIDVYNYGYMIRDFTYVDDIIEGIVRISNVKPNKEIPYEIYNIGGGNPIQLSYVIYLLEKNLNKNASINFAPMQPGDIKTSHADNGKIAEVTGFRPKVSIEDGVKKFVDWYKEYFDI
jgi:UDP-glucuronate 4-epimerase